MDVLDDIQKEHEKEIKKLKKAMAELPDIIVSLKNRNAELDEKRKKALPDYYETFLHNPLADPDNNLCERKARILKGKINQAISLRSFEHLTYFCKCLSVLDHFATNGEDDLYQSVQDVFKCPNPIKYA